MATISPITLDVPRKNKVLDDKGLIDRPWARFFDYVRDFLEPLGYEKFFSIVNNQASVANVDGLSFDSGRTSQAIVEYLIQRVTTGTGATELITTGVFHVVYKPTSNTWAIVTPWTAGPSVSGLTFSITSAGQVQYTSTNITGTASISKMSFRVRRLAAKNHQYSQVDG